MTPAYLPPEAINESCGRSGDVFSLGMVMSEMLESINIPWGPSSVNRRMQEYKAGKRRRYNFEPEPMTPEQEDFLMYMPQAGNMISQEDMECLFLVMMAAEPTKRPLAEDVWNFLRGRHFHHSVAGGAFPATCGRCCL
jgi:serine/threonine protein kinase